MRQPCRTKNDVTTARPNKEAAASKPGFGIAASRPRTDDLLQWLYHGRQYFSGRACGHGKAWQFVPGGSSVAQLQRRISYPMNNLLQEMLFCNFMLTCETHDCRAFFEFDEVAAEPMEEWSVRAAAMAESEGWVIGHTGLVKCPKCAALALENK